MDGENGHHREDPAPPGVQALTNGNAPPSTIPRQYSATATHQTQGRPPSPPYSSASQARYHQAHGHGDPHAALHSRAHHQLGPAPMHGPGFAHGPREHPAGSYHVQRHDHPQQQQQQQQHAYHPRQAAAYPQGPMEPMLPEPLSPRARQSYSGCPEAMVYDMVMDNGHHAHAGYHPIHPQQRQHQVTYPAERAVAAHGASPPEAGGAARSMSVHYQQPVRQYSHARPPPHSPYAHGYYSVPADPSQGPPASHEMAQRIAMHSPERWQGSLPAAYAGPQSAPGPRSNVGAADHYRASTSMATHIASPPLLPHPTSSLSPQQHYQQPAPPRYPNSAPTGASSYSAAAHAPAAGNHPLYMPARSAPHPDSALPHEAIPAAAVAMGVNDADIAMPNDTDEKILRRKRNAQSASRLRERRKQREADLEEAIAKLEAKIAELKKELAYEKQRAKERLRPGEMPDLSAAEPSDAESTAKSMSGAVAVGNKRLRGLCESPSASNASCRRAVALPETCPLRELDIVRFSELRTCIGALSELNQKIWVSVGSLRQGIQRISQNSAAKKAETAVAAH